VAGCCGLTTRPGGNSKSTASRSPEFTGIVGSITASTAALAAAEGFTDLLARLENDEDASVRAATSAAQSEAPPPAPEKDPAHDALHAVQAAIFGLTDAELAEHIGVPESQAFALAAQLVAQGRLTRRGKRLVSAQGGAA